MSPLAPSSLPMVTTSAPPAIILAIGVKTLSNYSNHFADTGLDAPFAHRAWRAFSDSNRQPGRGASCDPVPAAA